MFRKRKKDKPHTYEWTDYEWSKVLLGARGVYLITCTKQKCTVCGHIKLHEHMMDFNSAEKSQ